MIILISWGWTITFYNVESFDIFIPIAFMVGTFKIMILIIGKALDEDEFKMHEYHGYIGIILMILRVLFYVYFLFGLRNL